MMDTLPALIAAMKEKSHYRAADYQKISDEIGADHLQARLERQLSLYQKQSQPLRKAFRGLYRKLILVGMTCSGLLKRSRKQARSPECIEQEWFFENLPESFDGYRVLHLSDFHFDFIPELPEIVEGLVRKHAFDLCVLTGDFRGETTGPYDESLDALQRTRPCLGEQVYAVLGNHDNVEILLDFPGMNIELLMNRAVELTRGEDRIQVAGIDDPHFYQTHDLNFIQSDPEQFTLFLAHSPECWRDAVAANVDLQLSGHTHGGQICLPGGIPLVAHLENCPRTMIRGRWAQGDLQGYTSRGVGSSSLDLRLNCPPEITIHTLRRRQLNGQ